MGGVDLSVVLATSRALMRVLPMAEPISARELIRTDMSAPDKEWVPVTNGCILCFITSIYLLKREKPAVGTAVLMDPFSYS